MMKTFMKKMSILLATGMVISNLNVMPAFAAKKPEKQYGYAFKDGKLYSLELSGDKVKETLHDAKRPLINKNIKDERFIFFDEKSKEKKSYFLTDSTGKKVLGPYHLLARLGDGNFSVWNEKGAGVMNGDGKLLVPHQYTFIQKMSKGYYIAEKNRKYGVIDQKGKVIIPIKYDVIKRPEKYKGKKELFELITFTGTGIRTGLIDGKGRVLASDDHSWFRYDLFEDGLIYAYKEGDLRLNTKTYDGLIRDDGKVVLPTQYNIRTFVEKKDFYVIEKKDFYVIEKDESEMEDGSMRKFALISNKGKLMVPFMEMEGLTIKEFSKNLYKIDSGISAGIFDLKKDKKLNFSYDWLNPLSEGLARVGLNDKFGFLDEKGKVVIPLIYDEVSNFSEGLAYVEKDGMNAFINKKGEKVIELEGRAKDFSEGLALVDTTSGFYFIDKSGKKVLNFAGEYEFNDVSSFKNGLCIIQEGFEKNYQKGLMNRKGERVLYSGFDRIEFWGENYILLGERPSVKVSMDQMKYGMADKKGRVIISPMYGHVSPLNYDTFSGKNKKTDLFIIQDKSFDSDPYQTKRGLANHKGKVLLPMEYESISLFGDVITVGKKEGNKEVHGILSKEGKWIVPCDQSYLVLYPNIPYIITVKKEGAKTIEGLYTDKGKELLPRKYTFIEPFRDGMELAKVVKGSWTSGKQGYINKKGRPVLPVKYDSVEDIEEGFPYAKISLKEKDGIVNHKGKIILKPKYDWIEWVTK